MKTKEDFIKAELNVDRLTPIQWSGILRAMESYAQQQVKNCNAPAVVKSVCVRCGKPMANYKEDTNNCCNECWLSI